MSTDAAAGFLRALEEDDSFKDQCWEALKKNGPKAVVKLASDRGWEFTPEEYAKMTGGGEELDDEELENVAGGALGEHRLSLHPRVVQGAFARSLVPSRGLSSQDDTSDDYSQY